MSRVKADGRRTKSNWKTLSDVMDAGALALTDPAGSVVHVTPAPVARQLRFLLGRSHSNVEGGELPTPLAVTSALEGEGVSFVSRSLASLLAHDTRSSVCLVDLNWWDAPEAQRAEEPRLGLADVLRGTARVEQVVRPTSTPGFDLLAAGDAARSERSVLAASPGLASAMDELVGRYDHVVLDLPALTRCGEALRLTELGAAVLLVVAAGSTSLGQLDQAIRDLEGRTVMGAVLNRVHSSIPAALRRRLAV